MKQFIDKLIERLEEEKNKQEYLFINARDNFNQKCIHKYASQCYENAIEIINQLAEEHKDDIQTIDVSELLGEQVNDGWISVEDKLPELTEGTECFKQSKCCLTTLRWWDGDMTESVGWYNQSGVWNEDSKNCKVVAWMPLPPKYQPKGQAHD